MKKLVSLALLAVSTFSFAESVTSVQTLKVNSPDNLTNLSDLKVSLSVSCKYKSGILFPESKSCGFKTVDLKIQDGVLKIPEIEKFTGLHAKKLDNYDVSLSFNEGENYLSSINARGKDAVRSFNNINDEFNIIRFDTANIAVTHLGADFFGSELSKIDRASLGLRTSTKDSYNSPSGLLVVSPIEHFSWWRENFNSYAGKVLLKDEKEISLKTSSLGYFSKEAPKNLKFSLYYTQIENYSHTTKLKVELVLPLEFKALSNIGTIELK